MCIMSGTVICVNPIKTADYGGTNFFDDFFYKCSLPSLATLKS